MSQAFEYQMHLNSFYKKMGYVPFLKRLKSIYNFLYLLNLLHYEFQDISHW